MSGNEFRLAAISQISNRENIVVKKPQPLDKIWATDVFNLARMEQMLSKSAFKAFKETAKTGAPLAPSVADVVAAAMKS